MPDAAPPSFARRRPWLTGCGGLFAIVVLFSGILALQIHFMSSRRWAEFETRQDAAIARLRAFDGRRPPLLGPARPGNAWLEYKPALEAVARKRKDLSKEARTALGNQLLSPPKPEGRELAGQVLAECQELLAPLRKAVRCDQALFPIDWSKGFDAEMPPMMSADHAGELLRLSARSRRLAGDLDGAIDEAAVAMQLGLDLTRPPALLLSALMGGAVVRTTLVELKDLVLESPLSPAQLTRIASMLNAVDRDLPRYAETLEADTAMAKETLRLSGNGRPFRDQSGNIPPSSLWRYGFSRRIAIAEAASHGDEVLEAARRTRTMGVVEAEALLNGLYEDARFQGNPVTRNWIGGQATTDRSFRYNRAQLGLVRAAVAVRQGRGPADPDWPVDPYSLKPVGCKVDGAATRLWSVSRDGRDGTTGSWSPKKDDEDFVLELKR